MGKYQKSWSQDEELTIVQYYKEHRAVVKENEVYHNPYTTLPFVQY